MVNVEYVDNANFVTKHSIYGKKTFLVKKQAKIRDPFLSYCAGF